MTELILGFVMGVLSSITFAIGMHVHNLNKLKNSRLSVSGVRPGQFIKIEHRQAQNEICWAKCLSNDKLTEKILVEIEWIDSENENPNYTQEYILKYSSKELQNFHLLNLNPEVVINLHQQIEELEQKIKKHLEKEEYEQADIIQKQIYLLKQKNK